MKNKFLSLIAILGLISFVACEDEDGVRFIAGNNDSTITFQNSFAAEYLLSEQIASNIAERFVWNEVEFGAPTVVTYELQGSIDQNFSTVTDLGATVDNNLAVTVDQLLNFADELGLDNDPETTNEDGSPNNTGEVYVRVRAFAGTDTQTDLEKFSDVASMNITVIEQTSGEAPLIDLYLVGSSTAAGWDPNGNIHALYRSADNPDSYSYTGFFAAGEFKVLEVPGQWQPQWGTNDGTTLAVNDGTGSDPGAFAIDTEGYYTFTMDTDAGTFSIDAYDAASAPTFSTVAIIGDATPNEWNDPDTDMTQSTFDSHIWYIKDVTLTDGELKFRAEDDWADNWGASTALSGQGAQDGPNIPVAAGVYDIWFNDLTGSYILIPKE